MKKKDKANTTVPDYIKRARDKWTYFGQKRPAFAVKPLPGQRSVWDFPRPPAVEAASKRIEVKWENVQLADSLNGLELLETASPPTYYIPPEDIDFEQLVKLTQKKSLCEWKGKAEYFALRNNPSQQVAWSYARPFPEYEALKGHLAFYPQHVNCFLDGEPVTPQPGTFYAGWITSDLVGPFKGEPGSAHW